MTRFGKQLHAYAGIQEGPWLYAQAYRIKLSLNAGVEGRKIISVEIGGRLKHFRIPSRNIFKDLKKNLARFGVLEDVTLINGSSFDAATTSAVRQILGDGEVGLFIFDADSNVRRDLDSYGDLLSDNCWVVIDDYFGPEAKAAPLRAQVDEFVAAEQLLPFGYYGWGTWVGQWQRK